MTSGKHDCLMAVCLGMSKDMPSLLNAVINKPDIQVGDGVKNVVLLENTL